MNTVSRSDIGKRLAQIRGQESHEAFAARLGVHKNTYGGYERGQTEIGAEALARLALEGWAVHWLLTGQGPERLVDLVGIGGTAAASHPLKSETLTIALQLASEALEEKGLTLPTPKRAELVTALYELLEEGLPEAKVLRFARTAAA